STAGGWGGGVLKTGTRETGKGGLPERLCCFVAQGDPPSPVSPSRLPSFLSVRAHRERLRQLHAHPRSFGQDDVNVPLPRGRGHAGSRAPVLPHDHTLRYHSVDLPRQPSDRENAASLRGPDPGNAA